MQQIKLEKSKVISFTGKEEGEITTLQLINTAINASPSGGFTVTDMMDRLAVQKKVKDIEKEMKDSEEYIILGGEDVYSIKDWTLSLEDAEFKQLGTWVHAVKWGIISSFIVDFDQQFKDFKPK